MRVSLWGVRLPNAHKQYLLAISNVVTALSPHSKWHSKACIWRLNYPVSQTQGTGAGTALWEALVLNPFGWCAQGPFHRHLPPLEWRRPLHQVAHRNFIQCELLTEKPPPLPFLSVILDEWLHSPFLLKGQKFDNGHNYVWTLNECSGSSLLYPLVRNYQQWTWWLQRPPSYRLCLL